MGPKQEGRHIISHKDGWTKCCADATVEYATQREMEERMRSLQSKLRGRKK